MQINVTGLPEGYCLEVTRGGALIGYAIKFSGGWDAWALTSNRGRSAISRAARTVAVNTTRDAAIKAIANDWGEEFESERQTHMTPEQIIELAGKAAKAPWILGGASGRMITTPDGYVGDGFIADVDTLDNAKLIVAARNTAPDYARRLLAAEAECAALRELAERLIEDVDTLEFYYNSKQDYERWLEMRHEGGANGPVVIKPGLGDALLERLRIVEERT